MELTQQSQQAEVLVRSRLALEIDVGDVTNGSKARDPCKQLGCRGQVQTPAGAATAEPGAEGRRVP